MQNQSLNESGASAQNTTGNAPSAMCWAPIRSHRARGAGRRRRRPLVGSNVVRRLTFAAGSETPGKVGARHRLGTTSVNYAQMLHEFRAMTVEAVAADAAAAE